MPDIEALVVQLKSALWECCAPPFARSWSESRQFDATVSEVMEDARAFADKDPAARGSLYEVLHGYTSFKAVMHYRLAHAIACQNGLPPEADCYASLISSRGKLLSGAEIHTRCTIGKRFILDHGVGTVIGETSVIGSDCYVLGGVTLGARGIAGNAAENRHPILGNRVQVGAFARIFGCVTIGSDVFIGPHCVVTEDIPSGSTVTVRMPIEVTRNSSGAASSTQSIREFENEAQSSHHQIFLPGSLSGGL